jgi:hypothetical protein
MIRIRGLSGFRLEDIQVSYAGNLSVMLCCLATWT